MSVARQVRPPQQARSRASLERALQAGVDIIADGDWGAFTTAEICRRGEVAMGSLYARFSTKEDLILAVQQRILERIAAERQAIFAEHSWDELNPEETIAKGVRAVVENIHRNGVFIAMLVSYAAAHREVEFQGMTQARRFGEDFERHLLRHRNAFTHPDPELAVSVATRLLFDTLVRRVIAPPELSLPLDWEHFSDELVRFISAYLLHSTTPIG